MQMTHKKFILKHKQLFCAIRHKMTVSQWDFLLFHKECCEAAVFHEHEAKKKCEWFCPAAREATWEFTNHEFRCVI